MFYFLQVAVGVFGVFPVFAHTALSGGVKIFEEGTNHSSFGGVYSAGHGVTGSIKILYPPAPALDSIVDANRNDFPDALGIENFDVICTNTMAEADSHGAKSLKEYLSGTDPRNFISVF